MTPFTVVFIIFIIASSVYSMRGESTVGAVYMCCAILVLTLEEIKKISSYLDVLVQYGN